MTPTAVLCDLDGVVWLSHQAVPGSPEAVAHLRAAGLRVLFVTNNSAARIEDQEHALAAIDIPATGDVVTSAMAGADLVERGERVLVVGGAGVHEALEARGAIPVGNDADADGAFDAVVVGFHRDFDYEKLRRAATAVLAGARLIGTNDDPTYPTPSDRSPGAARSSPRSRPPPVWSRPSRASRTGRWRRRSWTGSGTPIRRRS